MITARNAQAQFGKLQDSETTQDAVCAVLMLHMADERGGICRMELVSEPDPAWCCC
jgi:hypothetical protein